MRSHRHVVGNVGMVFSTFDAGDVFSACRVGRCTAQPGPGLVREEIAERSADASMAPQALTLGHDEFTASPVGALARGPVSYTHLTLPTILLV